MFIAGSSVRIRYAGMVPGTVNMGKAEWRDTKAMGFEAIGVYWHKNYRAKHFTHEGAREYGYMKRKGEGMVPGSRGYAQSYIVRKKREKGHTLPLVYTGESRDASEQRIIRVKKHSIKTQGVQVVLKTPRLNWRHPKSRIRMSEEMTRVSQPEKVEVARVFDGTIEAFLRDDNRITEETL